VALLAIAVGVAGATSGSAAAQPARAAQAPSTAQAASTVQAAGSPAQASASSGAGAAIVLDSFSKPMTSPAKHPRKHHRRRHHRRFTPHRIARSMLHRFGWSRHQFKYLNWLWSRESSWNVHASNPYSGAYGIPQAVPGAKMASAGPHWQSSARTQIRWGLEYIHDRYGSPRQAWAHEVSTGWY
jgi:hypothetical protein